jgi:hypothetical protein
MNSIFTKKQNSKNSVSPRNNILTINKKDGNELNNNSKDIKYKNPHILESSCDDDRDVSDNTQYLTILSLDDIKKCIPNTASNIYNPELLNTHSEWRWRFFNIDGRRLVEISRKEPNKQRLYVDNTSKWTTYTLDKSWDIYVVDVRYYYTK